MVNFIRRNDTLWYCIRLIYYLCIAFPGDASALKSVAVHSSKSLVFCACSVSATEHYDLLQPPSRDLQWLIRTLWRVVFVARHNPDQQIGNMANTTHMIWVYVMGVHILTDYKTELSKLKYSIAKSRTILWTQEPNVVDNTSFLE